MPTQEQITKAKQPFVDEIFDKTKHAISKMGKDTYTIVLYFYFSEVGGRWFVELCYNTESNFRKYCDKENVNTIQSLKYYFSRSNAGNDNILAWRCKELGGYDGNIPEKYFREILSEVQDRILGENVFAEKFGKNIPFLVECECDENYHNPYGL